MAGQRVFETLQLGQDLQSFSPSFDVRGIAIDNPTGAWLYVETLQQYVPPYTIGWRRLFSWVAHSVSVRFLPEGPGGAPSQLSGANVTVWLFEDPVSNDEGTQYFTQRQPEIFDLWHESGGLVPPGLSTFTFTPGVNGGFGADLTGVQRLRVFGVSLGNFNFIDDVNTRVIGRLQRNPLVGFTREISILHIGPNNPNDILYFPIPIDLQIGESLDSTIYATEGDGGIGVVDFVQTIYVGSI